MFCDVKVELKIKNEGEETWRRSWEDKLKKSERDSKEARKFSGIDVRTIREKRRNRRIKINYKNIRIKDICKVKRDELYVRRGHLKF